MVEEYDYGFLDYDYYGEYGNDPLFILMINEQFDILRKSFYELDTSTKAILDYFIIQRNSLDNLEINADECICKLKEKYLNSYYRN